MDNCFQSWQRLICSKLAGEIQCQTVCFSPGFWQVPVSILKPYVNERIAHEPRRLDHAELETRSIDSDELSVDFHRPSTPNGLRSTVDRSPSTQEQCGGASESRQSVQNSNRHHYGGNAGLFGPYISRVAGRVPRSGYP